MFPGAVLLVEARGEIVLFEAYGHAALVPTPDPMTRDTVFDVASLTKPLITATLMLLLVAEGRITLDEPISAALPSWNSGAKAGVTVRHLLTHTSGLPAWRPFFQQLDPATVATAEGRARLINAVEREPLENRPGAVSRYSDLGFILLGSLIERDANQSLDRVADERIIRPLGLHSTGYLPVGDRASEAHLHGRRIAATESCSWRGRILRGEVHDENAYAMGGVSGHAGLFADARDVHRLVRAWRASRTEGMPFGPAPLAKEFLTRQQRVGDGGWALGWTVRTEPSTAGRYFSPRSFGHLGFTGTSIWVDPEVGLTVILLTNRVHPSRANEALASFRPA
ncbi:MAG: beta-lactamase family protein, partial [Nitrospirae bacterium]|nr:beta-lactamase family protein [Nitrospirota bacterium]